METKTKTKVLFIITKSNWGGAQKYVFDMATSLPKESFEAVVALGGNGVLVQKLNGNHIRTIQIKSLQRDISLKKELLSSWQIANIIKEEDPDILHINSSKAGFIGAILGRILGVSKVIFTAHGWAFNEDRNYPTRLMLKYFHWLTVFFSHTTITVSDALKKQMNWLGVQNKMLTIHSGSQVPDYLTKEIARAKLSALCPELKTHQNAFWTGTVAELHPVKRHDITIMAIAKLRGEGIKLNHIIIGDGQQRNELETLVKSLNLTAHVFFTGRVDNASSYLKAFNIFILTSRSEALGYVVLEAAQAGLPIIATRVGGIPEIVNDTEAILVASGNVDLVASSIKKFLNNPEEASKYGLNARQKSEQFSIEKMVNETIAVYAK